MTTPLRLGQVTTQATPPPVPDDARSASRPLNRREQLERWDVIWLLVEAASAATAAATFAPAFADTGNHTADWLLLIFLVAALVISGVRRTVSDCLQLTFSKAPLTRVACGVWLAALALAYRWAVYDVGWGYSIWPYLTFAVMVPVTIGVVVVHRLLCRAMRADVADRIAYAARVKEVLLQASTRESETGNLTAARDASGNTGNKGRTRWVVLTMVLLVVVGIAAGPRQPAKEEKEEPAARVGGSLTSMDYEPTDTFVRPVYVDGRGGDSAGTGGSTVLSAISLPQQWHPGLTVRVKWRRCRAFYADRPETEEEACRWIEKDVPVHPYTYVGTTWLHIFADEQVLVIPAMLGPRHPDYPGAAHPYKNFNERRGISRDD